MLVKATEELLIHFGYDAKRLKKELKDDDQFADKQPPAGVDGQVLRQGPTGTPSLTTPR
jgi:hypothetical protein